MLAQLWWLPHQVVYQIIFCFETLKGSSQVTLIILLEVVQNAPLVHCVFSLFGGVALEVILMDLDPSNANQMSDYFEHVWCVVVVTVKTLLNDTCICPFIHCMVGPTRLLCSMASINYPIFCTLITINTG